MPSLDVRASASSEAVWVICPSTEGKRRYLGVSGLDQAYTVLLSQCEGAAKGWLLPRRAGYAETGETWPYFISAAH